jgi:hypothetical protein
MKLKIGQALAFLLIATSVQAGDFKVDGIVIDVPDKFAGPIFAKPGAKAKTYAFTIPATTWLSPSTVLQITVYDSAAQTEQPASVSHQYLSQMLGGIELHRTEYQRTSSKDIRVAGFPGSVVSWQGKANGTWTNGQMFCVVTKSELLFFHVMGGGIEPNADMAAAIKAVENARKN